MPSSKFINVSDLEAGDVILCHGEDKLAHKIASRTDSQYTHAAICISKSEVAESGVSSGIHKTAAADLISRYSHVAAFRLHDGWSSRRAEIINGFVDTMIASEKKYNLRGVWSFVKRKEAHEFDLRDKLTAFFEGRHQPKSHLTDTYFCSELVVACFIAAEIISPSASVVYQPDTFSPGDLGRDPTFGTFLGYISNDATCSIPENDEFRHQSTYSEIFLNDITPTRGRS